VRFAAPRRALLPPCGHSERRRIGARILVRIRWRRAGTEGKRARVPWRRAGLEDLVAQRPRRHVERTSALPQPSQTHLPASFCAAAVVRGRELRCEAIARGEEAPSPSGSIRLASGCVSPLSGSARRRRNRRAGTNGSRCHIVPPLSFALLLFCFCLFNYNRMRF
jgi:hypothetical protein